MFPHPTPYNHRQTATSGAGWALSVRSCNCICRTSAQHSRLPTDVENYVPSGWGGAVVLWVVLIAWKCTFWQCPNISVSIETIAGLYARRLPTFEHAKPRLKPNQNVYTAHSIYTVFRCHVARRRWFVSFARQSVGRRKIAQLFDVECLCLRQTVKVAVCMASGSDNMSKSERENETLQHRQICVLI